MPPSNLLELEELQQQIKKEIKIPRLGFLGAGWIGRNRMQSIVNSKTAEIVYVADSSIECLNESAVLVPSAVCSQQYEDILNDNSIDGIVIATPSALHAEQTIRALEKGFAVFCQKPLGRSYNETASVVDSARRNNKLLGLDLSYRYTTGYKNILEVIKSGEIGQVYSVNLVFHNAYGPGKSWFYDARLSGGGCIIDLGIHLVDLALFALGFPEVLSADSRIFSQGRLINWGDGIVEDYASSHVMLQGDILLQLNCSWNLSAGKQAVIEVSFNGTKGGVSLKNVNGSYYDFITELYHGTNSQVLSFPPDDWGGRAAVDWVRRLSLSGSFDNSADDFPRTAYVLDKIYGRL